MRFLLMIRWFRRMTVGRRTRLFPGRTLLWFFRLGLLPPEDAITLKIGSNQISTNKLELNEPRYLLWCVPINTRRRTVLRFRLHSRALWSRIVSIIKTRLSESFIDIIHGLFIIRIASFQIPFQYPLIDSFFVEMSTKISKSKTIENIHISIIPSIFQSIYIQVNHKYTSSIVESSWVKFLYRRFYSFWSIGMS